MPTPRERTKEQSRLKVTCVIEFKTYHLPKSEVGPAYYRERGVVLDRGEVHLGATSAHTHYTSQVVRLLPFIFMQGDCFPFY